MYFHVLITVREIMEFPRTLCTLYSSTSTCYFWVMARKMFTWICKYLFFSYASFAIYPPNTSILLYLWWQNWSMEWTWSGIYQKLQGSFSYLFSIYYLSPCNSPLSSKMITFPFHLSSLVSLTKYTWTHRYWFLMFEFARISDFNLVLSILSGQSWEKIGSTSSTLPE